MSTQTTASIATITLITIELEVVALEEILTRRHSRIVVTIEKNAIKEVL